MKLNKIVGLGLSLVLSLGCLVGCNKTEEEKMIDNNEVFVEKFSKALDKRWDITSEADENLNQGKITENERNKISIDAIQEEIDSTEEALLKVTDEELKEVAKDYVEGDKLQIKYLNATDVEMAWDFYEQSQRLRKPSLIILVEEYGVKVNEEHIDTYNAFKEEATLINKEEEAKKVLDKMATECLVEKKTDEWGAVEYEIIFENNSEINFKDIEYQVNYKDKDDMVVGSDFIFLSNFNANTKQKASLYPYENVDDIESIVLTANYYEVK